MTRRRKLRPEEEDLWRVVARTARAMHAHPLPQTEVSPPPTLTPKDRPAGAPSARLGQFRIGEKAASSPSTASAQTPSDISKSPLRMDAKAFGKMTRGKLMPEARIDLHGMTVAEAHPELIRFVLNAQSSGMRLVLVITGKGRSQQDHGPIPHRSGVLRQQVPHWLRLAPLAQAVLQVTEAHQKHGGSGAYYVYLRRTR